MNDALNNKTLAENRFPENEEEKNILKTLKIERTRFYENQSVPRMTQHDGFLIPKLVKTGPTNSAASSSRKKAQKFQTNKENEDLKTNPKEELLKKLLSTTQRMLQRIKHCIY